MPTLGTNLLSTLTHDPARLTSWSPTFPYELVMREKHPRDICAAYGIGLEEWRTLCAHPPFIEALAQAQAELAKDGATFKVKARLQSEELLKKSWEWMHEPHNVIPPAVKADLFKFTVRAAGLDGSKDQAGAAAVGTALQINIDLSNRR